MIADMWQSMWERQKDQQVDLGLNPAEMTPQDKDRVMKDLVLLLNEETAELQRVVAHYKKHVLRERPIETSNVVEAGADVMKCLLAVMQLCGVNDHELYDSFMHKSEVVDDRARGERMELSVKTKVVVTDLDGCIATLGPWAKVASANGNAEKMLLDLEKLKEDFYRRGGFLDLDPIEGAVEGIKKIREMGFKLVIITARPHWQYKRVYSDTMRWLQKHGVEYDLILFAKDKAEALFESVYPARPLFFVEDRPKHAVELASIGTRVMFFDNGQHDSMGVTHDLVTRVSSWPEILIQLKELNADITRST
jgi:hypothetical protein